MGVLDDAIREHLELKRQHGAPDTEISAQEAEALGPARRGPALESEEPLDAEAAAPPDPDALVAEADEVTAEPEAAPFEPHGDPLEPAAEAPLEPAEPIAETEPVPPDEEHVPPPEPTVDVDAEPEPPAAIGPPGEDGPPIHDVDRDPLEPPPPMATPGSTQEFDTLSEGDDEERGEGEENVLEETPEFLRETPEHDRLWFEQKPPRDFDLED